jgi:hypothetical protein
MCFRQTEKTGEQKKRQEENHTSSPTYLGVGNEKMGGTSSQNKKEEETTYTQRKQHIIRVHFFDIVLLIAFLLSLLDSLL